MKKIFCKIMVLTMLVILALTFTSCGGNEDKTEILNNLNDITTVEEVDDTYVFTSFTTKLPTFDLVITKENTYLKLRDFELESVLMNSIGNGAVFNSNGEFIYDFDEQRYSIYVDYYSESDEMNISVISYLVEDDLFTLNIGGEKYEASDWVDQNLRAYGLVDLLEKRKNNAIRYLEDGNVSEENASSLTFADIENNI